MSKKKNKKTKYIKIAAIVGGVSLLAALGISLGLDVSRDSKIELITYREYEDLLKAGDIDTIQYNPDDRYMYISLHNDKTRKMTISERENYQSPLEECKKVYYPASADFTEDLLKQGVLVQKETDTISKMISDYGSLIFLLVLYLIMFRAINKLSPASAKTVNEAEAEEINVTFDDIIGHDEVKKDLKVLIKQMRSKNKNFQDLTHGILFEGSAGTGKTMLAKAVAKEAGFNFISVNSSSLIQMYVGLGAKRVREAFAKAREKAPCILFFDEIDAIGAKRGNQRSHAENDQTINALLAEMDGFTDRGDIFVIAATNRVADLDPALIRSGRFDRTIQGNR